MAQFLLIQIIFAHFSTMAKMVNQIYSSSFELHYIIHLNFPYLTDVGQIPQAVGELQKLMPKRNIWIIK